MPMMRSSTCVLMVLLALSALLGCRERPLTPAEIQDQHRFVTGCRPQDAPDYGSFIAYCDRF